jgi:flagellar biosynthesis protein FlhB
VADTQEKTDPASAWKRRELRKKGDVPKSPDVSAIVELLAVILLGHSAFRFFLDKSAALLPHQWAAMDHPTIDPVGMQSLALQTMVAFFDLIWPLLATALLSGVIANLLQVGFLVTGETLKPDFQRVNPLQGIKRMLSLRAVQQLVQSCLKVGVVAYVVYRTLEGQLPQLAILSYLSAGGMVTVVEGIAFRIFLNAGLALLILSGADYAFKRWQWERDKRMSKQEMKEEYKRHEGDPLVRQRIRQKQREIATRRMMEEVAKADVVITNPTHYAVALRYDNQSMRAPTLVAKGQRLIAARIKELARMHGIPVVSNPPLARSLFELVPLGREIPEDLYRAVAEVLAYVYRLRGFGAGRRVS